MLLLRCVRARKEVVYIGNWKQDEQVKLRRRRNEQEEERERGSWSGKVDKGRWEWVGDAKKGVEGATFHASSATSQGSSPCRQRPRVSGSLSFCQNPYPHSGCDQVHSSQTVEWGTLRRLRPFGALYWPRLSLWY